jgi:hypothetical protein
MRSAPATSASGMPQAGPRRGRLILAAMIWFAASGSGTAMLWRYENAPGAPAMAPRHWPAASNLERTPAAPTLVMLIHPQCACSRASIAELATLLARTPGPVAAHVLIWRPEGTPAGWEESDLWSSAAAIPGVDVRWDEHGSEAQRFGALTSGQTLLYSAAGDLLFSGGITASRGHVGDNTGRSAVLGFLARDSSPPDRAAVFGCALANATAAVP